MNQNINAQKGVFLLEALIAILIFSFGILGLVALQAVASQNSSDAENRTRASLLANDIVSQMWVNKVTNTPFTGLSSPDIAAWQTRVSNTNNLPSATGTVAMAGSVATVTITWRAPSKKSTESRKF